MFYNKKELKKILERQSEYLNKDSDNNEKLLPEGCSNWYRIFLRGKPICAKCKKEVDYFGPWYDIHRGGTRYIHAVCHGEIEIREMSKDHPYCFKYHQDFPNDEQLNRMGASFFGEFFIENLSIWRKIPHFHIWRYNNDNDEVEHARTCGICEVRQENCHKPERWMNAGESYFRQVIFKIKDGLYAVR